MSPVKPPPPDPTIVRLDALARRLDAIIALLVRSPTPSISDQIRSLGDMGFDNPAIARIVGRDTTYIGVVRGRKAGKTAAKKRGTAKKAKKK
jgi:hypothetical protein